MLWIGGNVLELKAVEARAVVTLVRVELDALHGSPVGLEAATPAGPLCVAPLGGAHGVPHVRELRGRDTDAAATAGANGKVLGLARLVDNLSTFEWHAQKV